MSAKRKAACAAPLTPIPDLVQQLECRHGFTREQLTRALESLRSLCPSCEPDVLRVQGPTDENTVLLFEAAFEEAERLLGADSVPEAPKRVVWLNRFGISEVRRVRGGRLFIRAHIEDVTGGPLAGFAPTAIRALAPDLMTLPKWRNKLRSSLTLMLESAPRQVAHLLEFPLDLKRHGDWPKDRDEYQAEMTRRLVEANSDFQLAPADLDRMVNMYQAAHEEITRKLLMAFDSATVEQLNRPALRLAVDNTRRTQP